MSPVSLGQSWKIFLRARAQIADNFWRNSVACPWEFYQKNGVLESCIIINNYYFIIYYNYYKEREKTENILRKPV
jgi:hypothetical protein